MAATTVNNNILREIDTGVYSIFGYRTPDNIVHVELSLNMADNSRKFSWICRNSSIHSMNIDELNHESITALIAAMRLSV